uniref:Uncharacterized protein n=1 Tax=Timema monikensis TaxID=170555 RepID=A0A7R9ED72_9NEOP|nr:unnamed protein product [Timema monikensis]
MRNEPTHVMCIRDIVEQQNPLRCIRKGVLETRHKVGHVQRGLAEHVEHGEAAGRTEARVTKVDHGVGSDVLGRHFIHAATAVDNIQLHSYMPRWAQRPNIGLPRISLNRPNNTGQLFICSHVAVAISDDELRS